MYPWRRSCWSAPPAPQFPPPPHPAGFDPQAGPSNRHFPCIYNFYDTAWTGPLGAGNFVAKEQTSGGESEAGDNIVAINQGFYLPKQLPPPPACIPRRRDVGPGGNVHEGRAEFLTDEDVVSAAGNEEASSPTFERINNTHLGKVEAANIGWKYNALLIERLEIKEIIGNGEMDTIGPVWEIHVEHGPPMVQKFVTRINPDRREYLVEKLTEIFKIYHRSEMASYQCDFPANGPCGSTCTYPVNICKLHFNGTAEERLIQINEKIDHKFSPKVLKFVVVVGKPYMGIVTDPNKMDQDELWLVDQLTVSKILANLLYFEFAENFSESPVEAINENI